jgi:hypothetical protein
LERARAARLAKEQAEEALEASERAAALLRKQEVLSATEQSSLIAEHAARKAADKMQETLQDIAHGRDRMLEEERVHAQRLNRARMQARQAQLRREVAEKETQQTKEIVTTHGAMQAHLLQLQQAQMRTELERDLVLSTSAAVNSDELREAKVRCPTAVSKVCVLAWLTLNAMAVIRFLAVSTGGGARLADDGAAAALCRDPGLRALPHA